MIKQILLVITLLIFTVGGLFSQQGATYSGPYFFVDVANLASKDTSLARLVVFIKVPYSQLLFSKYKEKFEAEYEFDVAIYDADKELVVTDSKNEKLFVSNVNESDTEGRLSFSRIKFNLPPGKYTVLATITDRERNRSGQRSVGVDLRTFREKPLELSDIIFADDVDKNQLNDVTNIHPNVFKSFEDRSAKFFAYFEIYDETFAQKNLDDSTAGPTGVDEIQLVYRVLNKEQETVQSDTFVQIVDEFQTFSAIDLVGLDLKHGKYILEIVGKKGPHTTRTSNTFDIRWNPNMAGELDVDLAIKQMEYIARDVDLGKVLKKTEEEQKDFFVSYWKKLDPTPTTTQNEVMEEYYKRVGYANRYYTTSFRDGWRTDMGMVYVTLGSPDDIERHPFEPNLKPYEVWYYYNLNTKFIFVDYKGFGEFELVNRFDFEDVVHR